MMVISDISGFTNYATFFTFAGNAILQEIINDS